jgi:BASS family bile acid:Na+ symporter
MKPGFIRTAALLLAMLLGGLLPQAYVFKEKIPWLVAGMLFIVFLQTRLVRGALRPGHFLLLAVNVAMGFAGWGLGTVVGGADVGRAAFFAGITPTATAAPVIMSFLGGRVEYVVAAFLLTNLAIVALLPALLPLVLGQPSPELFQQVLGTVVLVVLVPMGLAWGVRTVHARAAAWPHRLRNVSFGAWLAAVFLAMANASQFLRTQPVRPAVLGRIAVVTALVCAANFALGRVVGGRHFGREGSQALGQKNTALTIALAIHYAGPLVALGPTFYVVWHNLWNSWQLHRAARRSC